MYLVFILNMNVNLWNSMQIKQREPWYSYSSSLSSSFPNPISLPASSSSGALSKASKQKQGEKQPKETKRLAKAGEKKEVAAPNPVPAGFTTVWKALDKRRCNGFLDPASGRINLDPIASRSDFHGKNGAAYFTPQKSIAYRYAMWAKQKASIAEVMLIQIDVPFELTEGKFGSTNFTHCIWKDSNPDCEWNQLIWTSRRQERRPKKKNLAYLQKYGMLIGHIFTGRDSNITSLPDHSSITDKHLLKVYDNGSWKNGIQWVVQGEEGSELFEEKCRGHAQVWSVGQLAIPLFKET